MSSAPELDAIASKLFSAPPGEGEEAASAVISLKYSFRGPEPRSLRFFSAPAGSAKPARLSAPIASDSSIFKSSEPIISLYIITV